MRIVRPEQLFAKIYCTFLTDTLRHIWKIQGQTSMPEHKIPRLLGIVSHSMLFYDNIYFPNCPIYVGTLQS